MPRTPDAFPGNRIEEAINFLSGSDLPFNSGEMLYASGTVSGSGFFFNEEGRQAQVIKLPSKIGMVPYSVDGVRFVPAMPITSNNGWMVNSDGILLVSASID